MNLKNWLKKWELDNLKINSHILEVELTFNNSDKLAAWEMYIELLTRVTTQHLEPKDGDEKAALNSVFSIFDITRNILKQHGPSCIEFTKIAIVILNQVIRPFTAKWHRKSIKGDFENQNSCYQFRQELLILQQNIRKYTKALSDIAGVEDLTELENISNNV